MLFIMLKKMFDLKKEDHRIEEEDKEAFDAGKDSGGSKRRKNVLPEIGPNEERKKKQSRGKQIRKQHSPVITSKKRQKS